MPSVETLRRKVGRAVYFMCGRGMVDNEADQRAARIMFAALYAEFDKRLTRTLCGVRVDGFTQSEIDAVYCRMEANGLWADGRWDFEAADGPELDVELTLHVLVATGRVVTDIMKTAQK